MLWYYGGCSYYWFQALVGVHGVILLMLVYILLSLLLYNIIYIFGSKHGLWQFCLGFFHLYILVHLIYISILYVLFFVPVTRGVSMVVFFGILLPIYFLWG